MLFKLGTVVALSSLLVPEFFHRLKALEAFGFFFGLAIVVAGILATSASPASIRVEASGTVHN